MTTGGLKTAVRRAFAHLGGYSATVLTNAIIGLAVVPAVIYFATPDAWGAVAVGQAAGSIASLLLALGWGFNGPTMVALASPVERQVIVRNSLIARSLLAIPIGVSVAFVAALTSPDQPAVAVLAAMSSSLAGLGMTWFFIGAGDPLRLFLFDTLTRAAGTILGILVLAWTGSVLLFATLQLAGVVVAVSWSARVAVCMGPGIERSLWGFRDALRQSRKQAYAGLTVVTASTYMTLPTLLLATLVPRGVVPYALADRIGRFTLMSFTPVNQWLQSWVPGGAHSTTDLRRRIKLAVQLSIGVGICLGLFVALAGPLAANVLSGGAVDVGWTITAPLGISITMSVISRSVGMACLLTLGEQRAVALSAILGAVVGVPMMLVLIPHAGAAGAATVVATSETLVAIFQGVYLKRAMTLRMDSQIRRS